MADNEHQFESDIEALMTGELGWRREQPEAAASGTGQTALGTEHIALFGARRGSAEFEGPFLGHRQSLSSRLAEYHSGAMLALISCISPHTEAWWGA